MATSLHERQRLDSITAVMGVMGDEFKTLDEIAAESGLGKRTVWSCLQELDDELRVEPQLILMDGRWRTRYRRATKFKMRPLYQGGRHDGRPLAQCLGGYTYKGM